MRIFFSIFVVAAVLGVAPAAAHVTRGKSAVQRKPAVKRRTPRKPPPRVSSSPWKEPSYADSTRGDNVDGEDLEVRRAAVEALGPFNGSVVVADADSGRLLTVVNQKLAFSDGFQPCSTIKIVAALAALEEGIIESRSQALLVSAMARSSNWYFANLGAKLGFERVRRYARMLGLGEKAGLNIPEEQSGVLPSAPPKYGGVGMMTSFGAGIAQTPLELAAMLGALANGGTLYYLQYPKSPAEAARLVPVVKRQLEIAESLDEMRTAMRAVVDRGTGRRAAAATDQEILGKTGTCTDARAPTHLGWFGSFAEAGSRTLAVVVLLTGGRAVNGPTAAGIAGNFFKNLAERGNLIGAAPKVFSLPCCGE